MCLLIWEYGIHRIGPSHTLSGRHLFTHVSIPFIHDPRYLNLLPPHPGKLLSASSRVANVVLFPFAFFAQRSGPSKLFCCCRCSSNCLLRKQNRNETSGLCHRWKTIKLKDRPVHGRQRRRRTGLCWFVFAYVEDSRKRE